MLFMMDRSADGEQRLLCRLYLTDGAIKACIQSVFFGSAFQACMRWELRLLPCSFRHKHLQHCQLVWSLLCHKELDSASTTAAAGARDVLRLK